MSVCRWCLVVSGLLLLLLARRADATPAFARKYDVSCHTCHDRAYPELNSFGRQFKENGYQYPAGAEQPYRDRTSASPGTILDRIGLWRELPIALRAQGAVEIPVDAGASNRNSVNFRLLENLFLVGGGSLYKDISFFFSSSVAPSPGLHTATVGFHNLFFGEHHLNFRFGELLLFDFLHTEHRSLMREGNLSATVRVGLNPTVLDTSHLGFEIYGRLFKEHLFYQFDVVQGAQGLDGLSDLDSRKDLFGQLQLHFLDRQVLGALAYWGSTQVTDPAHYVAVRFTDPLLIVGGDAEFHLGRLSFYGHGLYGRHENPTGVNHVVTYEGVRAEITASLTRNLLAIVRFDGVFSHDDPTLERRFLSAHATYLVLTNLKVSAEFDADLHAPNMSTAFVLWDAAM